MSIKTRDNHVFLLWKDDKDNVLFFGRMSIKTSENHVSFFGRMSLIIKFWKDVYKDKG